MAQKVGYWTDDVHYVDGPFVMVDACGWRVEVKFGDHHCPVLPHYSIYEFLERNGFNPHKERNEENVAKKVDFLNQAVRAGEIVEKNSVYMVKSL